MKPKNYITEELDYTKILASDHWNGVEAACYFCGVDPNNSLIYSTYSKSHISDQQVQNLLDAINTWEPNITHPFSYIEKALKTRLIENLPKTLLSALEKITQNYTEEEKSRFINSHPNITKKLNLSKEKRAKKPNLPQAEIPLTETERKSLYKIILGMGIDKYKYDPTSKKNDATGTGRYSIRASLQSCGLDADESTIKKYLDAAHESYPEAKKINS